MHKVTAKLVDNLKLKEAAQYPLHNRPHDSKLSRKDIKHVEKFANSHEAHHADRAYQHEMDAEQFPEGSNARYAHHEAADANYTAAHHYAKLAKDPEFMHDFHGGKRMKNSTHDANDKSVSAHVESQAYYDWHG
jgi:hypothetical protein